MRHAKPIRASPSTSTARHAARDCPDGKAAAGAAVSDRPGRGSDPASQNLIQESGTNSTCTVTNRSRLRPRRPVLCSEVKRRRGHF